VTDNSTFKGSLQVRSTSDGYAVKFAGQTDAHDLGHAIAAIITFYIEVVRQLHPACNPDDVRREVFDGIRCGSENNPEPMRKH
jgi:hypothetical protein